jgi:hypothetical protein
MSDSKLTNASLRVYSVIALASLCLWPFLNLADRNYSLLDGGDLLFLFTMSFGIFLGALALYILLARLAPKGKNTSTIIILGLWISLFFNYFNFVVLVEKIGLGHPNHYYLFVILATSLLMHYLSRRPNFIRLFTLFVVFSLIDVTISG